MLLLLHIIVAYVKENIITKLQKFYSLRRCREDNESLTLFVKQPLCTGDLSPACEIFIERLEEDSECLCFEPCLWSHHSARPRVFRREKCFIKDLMKIKNLHFEKESPRFWKKSISWLLFIFLVFKSVEVPVGLRPF